MAGPPVTLTVSRRRRQPKPNLTTLMKKTIIALALASLCAGCEQRVETPPAKETTVVNPEPKETKETKETVVVPPAPKEEKEPVVAPPAATPAPPPPAATTPPPPPPPPPSE